MQIQTPSRGTMTHSDMLAALKIDLADIDLGISLEWATYRRMDGSQTTLHITLMRQGRPRLWCFELRENGTGHAFHSDHGVINYANLLEFKQVICGIVEIGYD